MASRASWLWTLGVTWGGGRRGMGCKERRSLRYCVQSSISRSRDYPLLFFRQPVPPPSPPPWPLAAIRNSLQLGPPPPHQLFMYLFRVSHSPPSASPSRYSHTPPLLSSLPPYYSAEVSCSVLPRPPLPVFYVQGGGNPHFVIRVGVSPSVSVSAEGCRMAEDIAEQLLLAVPHRPGKIVPNSP